MIHPDDDADTRRSNFAEEKEEPFLTYVR
jgi:hypothetical protein